ncbi:MAG: LapA family protein [Rhodospirillaceae bacterium]
MRILNSLLAIIVAVLVVLFAVSNRAPVVVEIWPFPYQLELGLYALILLAVFIGFLAGMITSWLTGGKRRRELRALRKETRDLQASLARAAVLSGDKDLHR